MDDANLENSKNPLSDEFSEEIISLTISQDTITINQETQTMEVHHHPDLHHKPKPWKEYILEGFMIFIAVTMGFFAEQIREHFVEKNIEEKYVQSLYNDLKVDTKTIQRTYDEKIWLATTLDSALHSIDNKNYLKNPGYIYYAEKFITVNDVFTSQDITYQQLKNSGGFRYFKNVELYKKMADYYNLYSRYQSFDGLFSDNIAINDMITIEAQLFNLKELNNLCNRSPHNMYEVVLKPYGKQFTPLINDEKALQQLYQKIVNARNRSGGSAYFLSILKRKTIEISKALKNEYHLKE